MSKYGGSPFVYSGVSDKPLMSSSGKVASIIYTGTTTIAGRVYNTLKLPTRREGPDSQDHNYRQEWLSENFEAPLSSLGLPSSNDIDWDNLSESDKQCTYRWNINGSVTHPENWTVDISPSLWANKIEANTSIHDGESKSFSILFNGHRYYNSRALRYIDQTISNNGSGWRLPDGKDLKGISWFFFNKGIDDKLIGILDEEIPEFNSMGWGTIISNELISTYFGAHEPGPRVYKPWSGGGYTFMSPVGSDGSFSDIIPTYPNDVELLSKSSGLSRENSYSNLTKTLGFYSSVEGRFWPIHREGSIADGQNPHEFYDLRIGISQTTGYIDISHNYLLTGATRYIGEYVPVFYSIRLCRPNF